jgi:hypothetical protein
VSSARCPHAKGAGIPGAGVRTTTFDVRAGLPSARHGATVAL